MTKLEEMWAALAAYQQRADAGKHGGSWARMCKDKTADAAAFAAAYAAAYAAAAAYARRAAAALAAAADADGWAQKAINLIDKAVNKEMHK